MKLVAAALLALAAGGCGADCPDATLELVPFTGAHVDHTELTCDQGALQQQWTACDNGTVERISDFDGCADDLRIALGRDLGFFADVLVLGISLGPGGVPDNASVVLERWSDTQPAHEIARSQPSLIDGTLALESWDPAGLIAGRVDLQFEEGHVSGNFLEDAAP